jgi:hypothetical protein
VALTEIKRGLAALLCAVMVSFAGTALADSGSGGGDDDDDENNEQFAVQERDPNTGEVRIIIINRQELEQRCEQDDVFAAMNVQTCNAANNFVIGG